MTGVQTCALPIFGVLLVGFMVFQPNGLVVFMKRWLPGWEEPMHLAEPPQAMSKSDVAEDTTAGDKAVVERT